MQSRTHGIRGEVARAGDLFAAQPADFAQEKHVSIEIRQRRERLFQGESHFLLRVRAGLRSRTQIGLGPSTPLAVVVERHVPRDPEQPAGPLGFRHQRNGGAADAQEDFLRQVARHLVFTGGAGEIATQAVPVVFEQRLGVARGCHDHGSATRNAVREETSRGNRLRVS